MAEPVTVKGGKFRVLLDLAGNGTYVSPCGFLSKSLTLSKGLEEFQLPDCDDPDEMTWMGRDATSLSMTISGEGVLASESVETWLDAMESVDAVATKVEIEFPTKTITWTGKMHVGNLTMGHPTQHGRVTNNAELSSDGKMTRVVT